MKTNSSHRSVLFIIDMIEGFVNEGPLSDPTIQRIIPSIRHCMDTFIKRNDVIIAINDHHHNHSREFSAFPVHCLAHTQESKMIPQLSDPHVITLHKNSVNAFMSPQFQTWFKEAELYQRYVICGCVSDICILHFALSLNSYFHEHDIDTHVVVVSDGIETYHHDNHDREEFNHAAKALMSQVGIQFIESEAL